LRPHAIAAVDGSLVVDDASIDERFFDNPQVTGPHCARSYVGVALETREGHRIGALGVVGFAPQPHGWCSNGIKVAALRVLARQIVGILEKLKDGGDDAYIRRISSSPCLSLCSVISHNDNGTRDQGPIVKDLFLQTSPTTTVPFPREGNPLENTALSHRAEPSGGAARCRGSFTRSSGFNKVCFRSFMQGLNYAIDAYPKQVNFYYSSNVDFPATLLMHEMIVFRSALAVAASAFEDTREGYVSLIVYIADEPHGSQSVVFEFKDTASGCQDEPFAPQDEPMRNVSERECVTFDQASGKIALPDTGNAYCRYLLVSREEMVNLHPVAADMDSIGGHYGCVRRDSAGEGVNGRRIFFSFPYIACMSDV